MPFPSEHAARQLPPGDFKEFRRKPWPGSTAGVDVIYGIRDDGSTAIQSFRFAHDKFTPASAMKWLEDHNFKNNVEPAKPVLHQGQQSKMAKVEISKLDTEKRLAFGWLYVSVDKAGNQVVDHSGEIVSISTIEDAAYASVLNGHGSSTMHVRGDNGMEKRVGRMVTSIVFTKEMQKALGIPDGLLPQGWFVGYRVDDDATWEAIKSGTLRCLSVGGRAEHKSLTGAS